MKINQKKLYSTHDLSCAAAINLFYKLWAIDTSNPKKAKFLFERQEGLDDLVQSYWSNTLKVSPLSYFQQLKVIKSRLYEQK